MSAAQPLIDAVKAFRDVLSPEERTRLSNSLAEPVPDVSAAIAFTASLDRADSGRRGQSIATRLYSLIESFQKFSGVVETLVSSKPETAALVWGSIKLALTILANFTSYFELFSRILARVDKTRPRFDEYKALFPASEGLQKALYEFHASIIRCCTQLISISRRRWQTQLFHSAILFHSLPSELRESTEAMDAAVEEVREEIALAKAREQVGEHEQQRQERQAAKEQRIPFGRFLSLNHSKDLMDISESRRQRDQQIQMKQRRDLIDGLSKYDHVTAFQQARQKRFKGTAEWIFSTSEFLDWKSSPVSGVLCLNGKIGSGKTILSAAVVDHLFGQENNRSPILFHFVRFDDPNSMSAETILRSLIRQNLRPESLSEEMTDCLIAAAKSLYSPNTLNALLERNFISQPQIFIVIDALDECPYSDRRTLMEAFTLVMSLPSVNLKLFVSTRGKSPGLAQLRQKRPKSVYELSTSFDAATHDIDVYIRDVLEARIADGRLSFQDPKIADDIRLELCKGAQGMFLWVALEIEDVCYQRSDEAIRTVLRDLPKNLTETFDRALRRISSRHSNLEKVARKALRAVAAAKRPLRLAELRIAISVEASQANLRSGQLVNGIDQVAQWCENLLYVDDSTDTVQFVHHSALKYVLEPSNAADVAQFHQSIVDCDHWLGEICVTYLNLNDFRTTLIRRPKQLPLMDPGIIQTVALKSSSCYSIIVKGLDVLAEGPTARKEMSEHTASVARLEKYRNQDAVATAESGAVDDLDIGGFFSYATQFWIHHTSHFEATKTDAAVWQTWETMVGGLHDLAKTPWTEYEYSKKSAGVLFWAEQERHSALLEQLFFAGDPPQGYNDAGILSLFVGLANEKLLSRLTSRWSHSKLLDCYGRALARGLITTPTVITGKSSCGCSASSQYGLASDLCQSATAGVYKPNAKGPGFSELVLLAAAWNGARDTLRKFLGHNPPWLRNTTTAAGKTALHLAAEAGHVSTTRLLLEEGFDFAAQTLGNKTPLLLAMDRSHDQVATLLMAWADQRKHHVRDPLASRRRQAHALKADLDSERERLLDLQEILSGAKTPRVRRSELAPAAMPHIMRANGL